MWAQFVIRHDTSSKFRLLAAETPLGRALYMHYRLDPLNYETNILLLDGLAWFKSEGSIRMCEGLGWPWAAAGIFRAVPLPLRDRAYELLAVNRFRLFGRRDMCFVPTPDIAARFLR